MTPTGNLFVIAAPSGGGKTSLTRALLERERGIRLSVSYTTRAPRPGEREGIDYHFITADRFMALKAAGNSSSMHMYTAIGTPHRPPGSKLKSTPGATYYSRSTGKARPRYAR